MVKVGAGVIALCALAAVAQLRGTNQSQLLPYPCEVEIIPTGTSLVPDSLRDETDFGPAMARDSKGYLYTYAARGGAVLRWLPSGIYDRAIGRLGEGPGEFRSKSLIRIYVVEDDSLYFRDGSGFWVVYDAALNPVRIGRTGRYVPTDGVTHFLDDGTILSTYPEVGAFRMPFGIYSREGELLREFGEVDSVLQRTDFRSRSSAYAGGDEFWVAPGRNPAKSYTLELWNTHGHFVRQLTRTVDWFTPRQVPSSRIEYDGFPWVISVHADSTGLLWTVTAVKNEGWRSGDDTLSIVEQVPHLDFRLEVLRADSGTVLASRVLTDPFWEVPMGWFPRSRDGWRYREDDPHGRRIDLVRMTLSGTSDECR